MPTISHFYGILIQMFFNDHAPAHFHVKYGEFKAVVDIQTLEVSQGKLPRRALALVREWAQTHRAELLEDWELCRQMQHPKPIQPLE
ncbi:DUF4160 domain-containing protein [Crenobacter cavernae]|uniref:DUF4160 domain-containing protein n=1 Tax=Crenobacter cavernae TaxID=2290923 RepID=A0A345Y3M8_9NEIS|nr:DUF4160 domain-containing protein [Crenobacter cavernae]AXK38530.1 DUF4160 domain-containing protein [Crenobacter cavernae]